MKQLFNLAFITLLISLTCSCSKEELKPSNTSDQSGGEHYTDFKGKRGSNSGKGKNKGDDSSDPTQNPYDTVTYASTYIISEVDDPDPLYKFKISKSGDLILLRTDSTVTSWGEDFWGSWADPFELTDNKLMYSSGLSRITYTFESLSDGAIDVWSTELRGRSYFPNSPVDTIITHPGVYVKLQ